MFIHKKIFSVWGGKKKITCFFGERGYFIDWVTGKVSRFIWTNFYYVYHTKITTIRKQCIFKIHYSIHSYSLSTIVINWWSEALIWIVNRSSTTQHNWTKHDMTFQPNYRHCFNRTFKCLSIELLQHINNIFIFMENNTKRYRDHNTKQWELDEIFL